ncbi:MAG: hypothetical protein ABH844_05150 [Candidatus Omnitrophota bacterium]
MKQKYIMLALLLLVAGAVLLKDVIIKAALQRVCVAVTGVRLDIRALRTEIFNGVIDIKDMRVYNPKGYPAGIMADVPELYVDIDLPELLKNRIKMEEARFYLKELNMVRIARGRVNINSILPQKGKKETDKKQGFKEFPKITVPGTLHLKADKVVFKDYTMGPEPMVSEFNINLDARYENVEDVYSLIDQIGAKVFKETAVANFMNVPITRIKNQVGSVYQKSAATVSNMSKSVAYNVKKLFNGVKK